MSINNIIRRRRINLNIRRGISLSIRRRSTLSMSSLLSCRPDEDEGFSGGPYELSLLPNFDKHVACKLWSDKVVSIIALFNLMICY